MKSKEGSEEVAKYIAAQAPGVREVLAEIRRVVREAVPDSSETISYKMPALRRGKVFFYYAAFKHHIGVYPPVTNDSALVRELESYSNEKGNLRFELNEPIPYVLIARVAVALANQYAK